MTAETVNLLVSPPGDLSMERLETLLKRPGVRVERIVSSGHATPAGEWYDQGWEEWVLLLSGSAALLIDGEESPRLLSPGDGLLLPARCRHRVEWTAADELTVWLALHLGEGE